MAPGFKRHTREKTERMEVIEDLLTKGQRMQKDLYRLREYEANVSRRKDSQHRADS